MLILDWNENVFRSLNLVSLVHLYCPSLAGKSRRGFAEMQALTFAGCSTDDAWYFLILSNTEWSAQPPSEPYL